MPVGAGVAKARRGQGINGTGALARERSGDGTRRMDTAGQIITGKYFDSVSLMRVAKQALELPGVKDAAAIMATAENKRILAASGMDWPGLAEATDTDLALGVLAESKAEAESAVAEMEALLKKKPAAASADTAFHPRSLAGALASHPDAQLALISIAGRYAAAEAMQAIEAGLHVMLFSDNVSLDAEIACKQRATEKGVLCMGPDCGTAIIGGVPLGFANVVRRGRIGLVAASGTGLQEVTSLIHQQGGGVSHAIGTGGRDIKAAVGGRTFLAALNLLSEDEGTDVLVLVSKTPDDEVLKALAERVRAMDKPVVAIFIGGDPAVVEASGAIPAATLEAAAYLAVALSNGETPDQALALLSGRTIPAPQLPAPPRRYLRGLFCGGTFAQETVHLLTPKLGTLRNNVTTALDDPDHSQGHTVIDLGGDEFTAGRAHPMIDFALRNRRLLAEADDPETGVILLDVVLGYGSHAEPAAELVPLFQQITERENPPVLLFHVCGTDADPQGRESVVTALEAAGGVLAPSNAAAAAWAGEWVAALQEGGRA